MKKYQQQFEYDVYDDQTSLSAADAALLQIARDVTQHDYAPCSHIRVGAAASFVNLETITVTNQENASFPVGICAERVALSTASSLYPEVAIDTIAISYHNLEGESNKPISPCGICRQTLAEYEQRLHRPIRLVLGGLQGKVFVLQTASHLLPLSFSSNDMG